MRSASSIDSASPASSASSYSALASSMPRSSVSTGSIVALSTFSSATTDLAVSWLSQKLVSPILASSSFLRASLVGKSKRVPDGEHPGAEVFDCGGKIVVDHGGFYRRRGGSGQGRTMRSHELPGYIVRR